MTRVSDQPAFAAAVAEGGALPFLALALADAEQTRDDAGTDPRALSATGPGASASSASPPRTSRAAQLDGDPRDAAHPRDHRGRPAGPGRGAGGRRHRHLPARALAGTAAPVPATAGARRFVFEGSECGGHVGPRTSFPLWEAQLGVLADFLAGDRRCRPRTCRCCSPAASTTSARPRWSPRWPRRWPRRGAAIGVLMGTAYLFTARGGRRAARSSRCSSAGARRRPRPTCWRPRRATPPAACAARSPRSSRRSRRELRRTRACPSREVWEQLEKLNVGRLRIASKGMRTRRRRTASPSTRTGSSPRACSWPGEVAVLRSAVTTIAGLHAAVTEGAARTARRAGARAAGLGAAEAETARARAAATSRSSAWPACSRGSRPGRVLGERPRPAPTRSPRCRPSAGTRTCTTTPTAQGGRGRRPSGAASCPRSASTRCATASRRPRWPASNPCSCWRWRSRAARWPTPGTPTRGRSTAPGPSVVFGAEAGSDLSNATTLRYRAARPTSGELPARAGRAAAAAHRGLLPRRAGQRHRRPDRQPARPRRRQLHRRRGVRLLAGRGRRRLQGADRRHQRPGAVRRRRPAQRHQRLPAVRLGARAVADRAVARRSTARPTASRSARASPAWCSSASPTPSATATGSTR